MGEQTDILVKTRMAKLREAWGTIPRSHINLWLYFAIAYFTAWTAALSTDEAAKFIASDWLFWARSFCATNSAGLLAIKMVMSNVMTEPTPNKP